ncbi:MAG: TetR/AcrR family transcriptional regulator [Microbacterium sp.]
MDARVVRTRASLQQALLDLALERRLDEITVNDIVERAGVNRSSFYQHYGDKELLLADALEQMILDMPATVIRIPTGEIPDELGQYLRLVLEHRSVFRQVLGPNGSIVATERLSRRIESIVQEAIAHADVPLPPVPIDVIAAGVTGTAMGVISAWVARDPMPSVDVAAGWLWTMLTAPVPVTMGEA